MRGVATISCTKAELAACRARLDACSLPFSRSEVYSTATESHYVDEGHRSSAFRRIYGDGALFDVAEKVVQRASAASNRWRYHIHRNDATHIRYTKGGFFKSHHDYLSLTSNRIVEYTLLICVTKLKEARECKGGDTVIHGSDEPMRFNTTTPGKGVIFRKDLDHEGSLVSEGVKEILSFNVWAVKKDGGQILSVIFDNRKEEDNPFINFRFYAIQVHDILSPVLLRYIALVNSEAKSKRRPRPELIEYKCPEGVCTYQEFQTVYLICLGARVTQGQLIDGERALRFFGPFDSNSIIADVALRGSDEEKIAEGNASTPALSDSKKRKKKAKKKNKKDNPENKVAHPYPMIICKTRERTRVVAKAATALDSCYVPFRLIMCEGKLSVSGDTLNPGNFRINMTPGLLCVGDYEQVAAVRNFVTSSGLGHERGGNRGQTSAEFLLRAAGEKEDRTHNTIKHGMNNTLSSEEVRNMLDLESVMRSIPGLKYSIDMENELQLLFSNPWHDLGIKGGLHLPGVEMDSKAEEKPDPRLIAMIATASGLRDRESEIIADYLHEGLALFHRNKYGKACFTPQQATRTLKRLVDMGFIERAKRFLINPNFVLPQRGGTVQTTLCNEHLYGNFAVIEITGIVRLDPLESFFITPKVRFEQGKSRNRHSLNAKKKDKALAYAEKMHHRVHAHRS